MPVSLKKRILTRHKFTAYDGQTLYTLNKNISGIFSLDVFSSEYGIIDKNYGVSDMKEEYGYGTIRKYKFDEEILFAEKNDREVRLLTAKNVIRLGKQSFEENNGGKYTNPEYYLQKTRASSGISLYAVCKDFKEMSYTINNVFVGSGGKGHTQLLSNLKDINFKNATRDNNFTVIPFLDFDNSAVIITREGIYYNMDGYSEKIFTLSEKHTPEIITPKMSDWLVIRIDFKYVCVNMKYMEDRIMINLDGSSWTCRHSKDEVEWFITDIDIGTHLHSVIYNNDNIYGITANSHYDYDVYNLRTGEFVNSIIMDGEDYVFIGNPTNNMFIHNEDGILLIHHKELSVYVFAIE